MNPIKLIGLTTALGAAMTAAASQISGVFPGSTDFEGVTLPDSFTTPANGAAIVAGTPDVGRPTNFVYNETRTNVLSTAEAEGTVLRNLKDDAKDPTVSLSDGTIYVDLLFNASTAATTTPPAESGDKILVYLKDDGSSTNLCVFAGAKVGDEGMADPGEGYDGSGIEFPLVAPVEVGTWNRLVVEAVADVTPDDGNAEPGFKIYLGGYGPGYLCSTADGCYAFVSRVGAGEDFEQGIYNGTVEAIGFRGAGLVDDLVLSTNDPSQPAPVSVTLEWDSTLTDVAYVVGGVTSAVPVGSVSYDINVAPGTAITLIGTSSYGRTVTASGNTTTPPALTTAGIDWYFPQTATAGQDGSAAHPFEIATAGDLIALKDAVANVAAARSLCYVQTADIDMALAGAFAGIGTYAANLNNGVAFTGTYDGQGYKISNIDFAQRNYGGVFNQVKGGTIKNLTVENITCSTFSSSANEGEWGCAIVGNAGMGATLQGLVAEGDFGTAAIPCSHNVAGIAIRVCGGASNVVNGVTMLETLVKDCTNNATLHGFYTKAAGITALTQDQNGVPNDYVLFDGCVNNANIAMVEATGSTLSKIGRDGLSGILGYVSDNTKFRDCVNSGTLTSALSTAKIGGIVGWANSRTIDDLGGNANLAGQVMIGSTGSTINGFKYATVDNGVATTVTALAKDTPYLLEGNVAASETPVFTLAADGDTIAFDTALGYTFAGTVTAAEGLEVAFETVGTVTTYTAALPATADWVADPETIVAGTDAATQYSDLASSALADADAKDLTVWAKANNVDFTDVVADPGAYVDAFLLNCDPDDVDDEKEAFVATITIDDNGVVTVAPPAGNTYNGQTYLQGANVLSNDPSDWSPVGAGQTGNYKFFRLVLDF